MIGEPTALKTHEKRPKLPDIFINRRLNFSCVSFLGLI